MRCPSCGFDTGNANRRSNPDHNRLFGLIHKAFHQWPEGHRFKPMNADHLRSWLICAAGGEWREVHCTFLDTTSKPLVAEALRDAIKGNAAKKIPPITNRFVVEFSEGVAVFAPKSMSFTAMSQSEFGRLRDAITDVIEHEIGCKVEDLMREAA